MTEGSQKVVALSTAAEVLGRRMSRTVGRRRMELILEKPEARALVQALPAEDLYFLVMEVGLSDAAELVGYSSPEQFQTFVDLDAWSEEEGAHHLSPVRFLRWLAASRQGDAQTHPARWAGLDLEVIELLLRSGLRLIDKREEEEAIRLTVPDDEYFWHETPCGNFRVAFTLEDAEGIELRRLLDDLYAEDPFAAARLLSAIRWELDSELEEHATTFRSARLEELGFPSPEVAASLYARVNPDLPGPAQPAVVEASPGFFLAEFQGGSFLDRAAGEVRGAEARTQLDRGLMYLANTVMVADRVHPTDLEGVREAVSRMRAYLNLGLSHLAQLDLARGAQILATVALKHVFQVGFTLTLRLRWRVERLASDLGTTPPALATRFEAPEREVLTALAQARPRYGLALDAALSAGREAAEAAPPAELGAGVRPFATLGDLETVARVLERVEAWTRAARAAGLLEPGDLPFPVLALTAALRHLGGGPFLADPLSAAEARQALQAALDAEGAVTGAFVSALTTALAAAGVEEEDARVVVQDAASRLARELGPLRRAGSELDPRFVQALRLEPASD